MDDVDSANERHAAISSWLDTMKRACLDASTKKSQHNKKQRTEESNSNSLHSDDYEEMNKSSSDTEEMGVPHSSQETKRKLANRKYAKASYLRKKKLIEDLKRNVASLKGENRNLKEEQGVIKSQIKYWRDQMNMNGLFPSSDGFNSPKHHET
mmetsp:Transcript_35563/g.70018  ORF Transcript_35563/g.70018 Transcript_35563/m.70018 type:complete len:153 (-) Transcript_35563:189-647(-)